MLRAVGPHVQQEVLDGLMFGAEDTLLHENEPDLLSFGHVTMQEFAAADFIAPQKKVCFSATVLVALVAGPNPHKC